MKLSEAKGFLPFKQQCLLLQILLPTPTPRSVSSFSLVQSRKEIRTKSPFRVPKEFRANLSNYNGICSLHTTVVVGEKTTEVGKKQRERQNG